MIASELVVLTWSALLIGIIHTLLGPDHYLPFITIGKAKSWKLTKVISITLICGLGHVLSSVLLGFLGIFLGMTVFKLEKLESVRGEIAAWLLIVFGFTYFVWGVWRLFKNRPHVHNHGKGDTQVHLHKHSGEHSHVQAASKSLTPWLLFIIFIFGPCEPLIPLLMYPAALNSMIAVWLIVGVFTVTTLLTMVSVVVLVSLGLSHLSFPRLDKYAHVVAGFIIFACGCTIKFGEL